MKTEPLTAWKRLEQVIRTTGHTVNSFAKHIGLPRGENLYQIKRGNNEISRDLARRIHQQYPVFSTAWLICGEEEILPPNMASVPLAASIRESPVVRIPIYHTTDALPPKAETNDFLILSAAAANGATFALPYADDILNPFLRDSLVLLRPHKGEIMYGNIYLVETDNWKRFRILEADKNPDNLRLVTILPARFGEVLIRREMIRTIWLVCGAISKFGR